MPIGAHEYYGTLGVSRTASTGEIRRAYKILARQYHPDLNPGDKLAEERFKDLQEAYHVLIDASARRKYDLITARPETSGAGPRAATDPGFARRRGPVRGGTAGYGGLRDAYAPPPGQATSRAFDSLLGLLVGACFLMYFGQDRNVWDMRLPPGLGLGGYWGLAPFAILFLLGLLFGRTRGSFLVGSTLINAAAWGGFAVYCLEARILEWPDIVHMWPWMLPTHLAIVLGAALRRSASGWTRAFAGHRG